MKKIVVVCVAFIFALSMGGISFAGKDQGNKKGKRHEKKEYKEYKHEHKKHKEYKKKEHGQGPPPHAPAHGYRHKHSHGVTLEYDANIGVYTVIDFEDHYYQDDNFFRVMDGAWNKSENISGPWTPAPKDILPPGLPPLPPPPPMPWSGKEKK